MRKNLIAYVALFFVLGGTSFAAVQALPANSVGAKQLKKNAVTNAKIKNGAVTGAKIRLSSVGKVPTATKADTATHATSADTATNATNAANAANAANASKLGGYDPTGFEFKIRWVLVNADGTIAAQSGSISVVHGGTGYYFVDFGAPVTGHSIIASLSGRTFVAGEIVAQPCGSATEGSNACSLTNDTNHVLVDAYDATGAYADHAFYLTLVS